NQRLLGRSLIMGVFSDPCPNPDCNARVKKRANFCSKCGWAGPNSLVNCPECGKKAGRGSRFCWNCGADMQQSRPPRIVGNCWVREPEELAVRVDPQNLKGFLSKRVTVEPGTIGCIEKNGRVTKNVEWGTQTLDHILKVTRPSSILLFSAADLVLRPAFRGLTDANNARLDVTVQAVLRIKDHQAFVRQFFEGHKRRVTFQMLEDAVAQELHDVMRALITHHSIEEMYGNLAWRDELEEQLRDAMMVTLDRYGLDLLQINFVDFGGDHYEKLQEERGEVYMGNRGADFLAEKVAIRRRVAELDTEQKLIQKKSDIEYAKEVRELDNQYGIRAVLSDAERVETVNQARHELNLKKRLRNVELEDLERQRKQQTREENMAWFQELEQIQVNHQNEIAMGILLAKQQRAAAEGDFRREQERLQNRQNLEEAWARSEQQRREQRANAVVAYEQLVQRSQVDLETAQNRTEQRKTELDAVKAEKEVEQQDKRAKRDLQLESLERMTRIETEQMEAMKRLTLEEKKIELDYKRFEKEQESEVQLATINGNVQIALAQSNTEAAVASAISEERKGQIDELKTDKQALREESNKRAEELTRMADSLSRNLGQQGKTTIASSAGGTKAGDIKEGEYPCPNCQRPVPIQANFCPWCDHDMRAKKQ
ncbi:MAG: hypothetical protein R6V12_13520, partial [Candidatus Hydrogenedentota bacterium]